MSKHHTSTLLLALLIAVPARVAAEPDLPEGGTVLLLGDSITWQDHYAALVESYLLRRYPEKKLRVVNRGLRGDTAAGALDRIERDVLPFDPDLIVVMLGMNDGGLRGYNRSLLRVYLRNMRRLIDALQRRTKARLLLVTPTPVAPRSAQLREYNEMLQAMSAGLIELAKQIGVPALDLNRFMRRHLRNSKLLTPTVELMADPIHPARTGHLLIADHLLRRLDPDLERKNWTRIRVDGPAPPGKVHAFNLVHDHRNVYVPPSDWPAGRLASFEARWNRDVLKVAGLEGRFRLRIGNRKLGEYWDWELAGGMSVDRWQGAPWVEEARRLHALIRRKWALQYYLWDPREQGLDALRDAGADDLAGQGLTREAARALLARTEAELRDLARPKAPVTYRVVIDRLP